MTYRVKRPPIEWVSCPTREMAISAGVSSDTLKSWRVQGLLTSPLYWWTLPGSEKIVWNRDLIRDWIVNGADSPAHTRACEKFLRSLPSSNTYIPSTAA